MTSELQRFKILKDQARKKSIQISEAPCVLSRHINNISFYFTKLKTIFWVLEVIVPFKDTKGVIKCSRKYSVPISEDTSLYDTLVHLDQNEQFFDQMDLINQFQ